MSITPGQSGTAAGGDGVLGLGPLPNTFGSAAATDRAAAETLRNTQTNNATWLAKYNGNLAFWIRLVWDDGVVEQRRNPAGTSWQDVTNVIRGPTGIQGVKGPYYVEIFRNSATALTVAPTGGSVVVATGALTPPTGSTAVPVSTAAGEDTYRSVARINPFTQTGTVTPIWSVPIDIHDKLSDAQVKTKYEANPDTNAFTDSEKTKLTSAEANATADQTSAEIVTKLSGLSGAARLPSSAVKDLPSSSSDATVDLGLATISASGFTTAAPGGRTTKYPSGTILLFEVNNPYSVVPTDDVGSFNIGAVRYDFYQEGATNIKRGEFEVDTSYMCVVSTYGHIQLSSPYRRVATTTSKGLLSGTDKVKIDRIENAFTDALKAKLAGIATAATAVSVIDVLAKIFAGTGININKATAGQITISATGSGSEGTGTADGVVRTGAFDETTQIVTLTTSLGGTVTVDLGVFVTAAELTTALASYTTNAQARDEAGKLLNEITFFTYANNSLTFAVPDASFTPAMLKAVSAAEKTGFRTRIGAAAPLARVTNTLIDAGADETVRGFSVAQVWRVATQWGSSSRIKTTLEVLMGANRLSVTAIKGAAALSGATFTGAAKGIDPVADDDFMTLAYFNTHKLRSPIVDDLYFGTSDDAIPVSAELTIAGVNGAGVFPIYVGAKHLLIARLASEGDINAVINSRDSSAANQIGAFTKFGSTIMPPNVTEAFSVWVSNQAVTNVFGRTLTVS